VTATTASRTVVVLGAATGSGTTGSGPRAIPGPRSLTFRFMLQLQRWCRQHRRRFPRHLGRFLLTHGAVPLLAIVVGLAGQIVTFLPPLMLPIHVWPFTGAPSKAWDRYLEITTTFSVTPWTIAAMSLIPYLLTLALIWFGRSANPTMRRRRFVQVASWVVIVGTLPLYDVALAALALIGIAGLAWAFAPPAINTICRYLGFRPLCLGGR